MEIKKLFNFKHKDQVRPSGEVIPARCTVTNEDFEIIVGYENGKTIMISGQKNASPSKANASSLKNGKGQMINIPNGLYPSKTYHCPICGNKNIVRCGKCGHITCYDGKGAFRCAYCGHIGDVFGTIQKIEVYKQGGLKQDEMKVQGGLKFYPGDK